MNKYLVFYFNTDYYCGAGPCGGWDDLIGTTDDLGAAKKMLHDRNEPEVHQGSYNGHVVSLESGAVVFRLYND